ncbi:MAG: LuxR C-terminal-related transcriptional regulator [Coriobacteriales bacterium]|jgi:DNA-binding CsgD family transcriptional regulator|nr:LuxR C-terminal-related transcriptional regulator [Coriobacteriales bacterium]
MFSFSQDFRSTTPWAFLAVLSCWLWFWLVGYSPAFIGQGVLPASLPNAERLFFFLFTIAAGILCTFSKRTSALSNNIFIVTIFILLFTGTSAFALAGYQTLLPQSILATIGTSLMGFAYGWALVLSQCVLFRAPCGWDIALIYIPLVAVATIVLALIYAFIPTSVQALLPIIPVITWGISLLKAQSIENIVLKEHHASEVDRHRLFDIIRTPLDGAQRYHLIQLIAICVIVIALRSVGDGGLWGDLRGDTIGSSIPHLLPLIAVVILFPLIALPIFWLHTRSKNYRSYQIPLLVFIGILLALIFMEGSFADTLMFSLLAATADNFCLTIFCFVTITAAQCLPYPARFSLGLASSFNHTVALLWMIFFETTGRSTNLIVLLVSYVLVLLIAFRHAGTNHSAHDAKATPPPFEQLARENQLTRYQNIAELHSLTNRESEILILLAQGRSAPYIQSALTLSEGTVRTHVSHIYSKLGVHSKQELIDRLAQ